MNFLGHAVLAQAGSDEQLLGCLIADGIKGRQALESLPLGVRQGIVHHRLVDTTIDAHPRVQTLVKCMPKRRFAAIALDVVWDYCLHHSVAAPADRWDTLIQRCHNVIHFAEWLPSSKASLLRHMVSGQWLARSAEVGFVLDTLMGIGQHLRRPQDFSPLCQWVNTHITLLEHAFVTIWQDLWQQTNIATGTRVFMPHLPR